MHPIPTEIQTAPPVLFIFVDGVAIFCHRFMIVTFLTKALPVTSIPEELRIASVGYDVVDNRRLDVPTFLQAPGTQWIGTKKCPGLLLPARAVPFLLCCPLLPGVQRSMLVAVLRTVRYEPRAARVLARCVWSSRHCFPPKEKPARKSSLAVF